MGRFYKTHKRWISNKPTTAEKTAVVIETTPIKVKEPAPAPVQKEVEESSVEVVDNAPVEEYSALMTIEKHEAEDKIVCEILTTVDCDEIRYNIGSRKVTEKNRSKCKLYEGKFVLEEPSIINASAFKDGELLCSVQG